MTTSEGHGLTVHDIPRPGTPEASTLDWLPAIRDDAIDEVHLQYAAEQRKAAVTTDLRDLRDVPLGDVAEAARAGEAALEETLRRIAPRDGSRVLLVAASFNSAI